MTDDKLSHRVDEKLSRKEQKKAWDRYNDEIKQQPSINDHRV